MSVIIKRMFLLFSLGMRGEKVGLEHHLLSLWGKRFRMTLSLREVMVWMLVRTKRRNPNVRCLMLTVLWIRLDRSYKPWLIFYMRERKRRIRMCLQLSILYTKWMCLCRTFLSWHFPPLKELITLRTHISFWMQHSVDMRLWDVWTIVQCF